MHSTSCPPRITAGNKSVALVVSLTVVLTLGAMLFFLNPARSNLFPPCAFHKMTGLYCPGCGSTRALHRLLHGDIRDALHDNALFVLALPIVGALLLVRTIWPQPATAPRRRWGWVALVLFVVVMFGVIRNIRRPPFSFLAPVADAESK